MQLGENVARTIRDTAAITVLATVGGETFGYYFGPAIVSEGAMSIAEAERVIAIGSGVTACVGYGTLVTPDASARNVGTGIVAGVADTFAGKLGEAGVVGATTAVGLTVYDFMRDYEGAIGGNEVGRFTQSVADLRKQAEAKVSDCAKLLK